MSVATAELHDLNLANRMQSEPPPQLPANISERAARAVKEILDEQRVGCLNNLMPELVEPFKSFKAKHGTAPTIADLVAMTGLSTEDFMTKLGTAAIGKLEYVPKEFRDVYRELSAGGKSPTVAEIATRANLSEQEVLGKFADSAGVHLGKVYLRLRVVGGGCSGFEHKLDLDPTMNPKMDESFEVHGVPVAIDKRSLMYLNGVSVDYHNDLNRRGFSITNPSAKTTCGCGSSFSM